MTTAITDRPRTIRHRRRRVGRRVLVALGVALASISVGTGGLGDGQPAHAACTISVTVRLGARNAAVSCVQSTLVAAGYQPGPVDGWFGSTTRAAVVAYQRAQGLVVDGVVGPQTARSLGIWGATTTPARPAATPVATTPAASSTAGCTIAASLSVGARGAQVRCAQSALAAAGFSPGPVDGVFGNQTRTAAAGYQRARGLSVDGVVGRQTATALGIWPGSAGASTGGAASAACTPPSGVPAAAQQVVVVNSSGTTADVDLLVRSGSTWTCARMNMTGRVGRNGVRAIADRRSGDGTTPAGIFALGSMTAPDGQTFQFFGNGTNPGVPGTWRQVKAGDCWDATPGRSTYNTLTNRTAGNCGGDDEYLPDYRSSYSAAALIGANMGSGRSGDQAGEPPLAAAIFLHHHSYAANGASKPTSGCVSLGAGDLAAVLRALVPEQAYFVIR